MLLLLCLIYLIFKKTICEVYDALSVEVFWKRVSIAQTNDRMDRSEKDRLQLAAGTGQELRSASATWRCSEPWTREALLGTRQPYSPLHVNSVVSEQLLLRLSQEMPAPKFSTLSVGSQSTSFPDTEKII